MLTMLIIVLSMATIYLLWVVITTIVSIVKRRAIDKRMQEYNALSREIAFVHNKIRQLEQEYKPNYLSINALLDIFSSMYDRQSELLLEIHKREPDLRVDVYDLNGNKVSQGISDMLNIREATFLKNDKPLNKPTAISRRKHLRVVSNDDATSDKSKRANLKIIK